MAKKAQKAAGLGQRAKAQAQRAARAARELERGVAIRAGGKKAQGVKRLPETSTRNLGKGFGLEQTGKGAGSRMATRGQRAAVAKSGRKRIAGGAGAVGAMTLFGGDKEKKEDTAANKSTTPAKKKYNVGVSKGGVPFKEAFRHHRNKGAKTFTWNGKKYTTELDTEKAKRLAAAKKPAAKKKVGGIRRALFGADGKMGGDKGLLDNKLTRAFTKRDELNELRAEVAKKKPVKKMGGGMMKSKMASKGGARGGKKMPGGMKNGGMASKGGARGGKKFPDMTGDGRVTQKDILKARGVPGFSKGDLVVNMVRELSKLGRRAFEKQYGKTALNKAIKETNKVSGLTPTKTKKTPTQKKLAEADRRAEETKYTRQTPAAKKQRQVRASEKRMERMKNGGMAKKGYARGGMAKKGYSKGGAVRRGKPRGVGAALRGYGKALK
tara:strand:- start:660 stop:1973 length:1314 start_codon:yes stop_codon:yes gene_type:complete